MGQETAGKDRNIMRDKGLASQAITGKMGRGGLGNYRNAKALWEP